MFMPASNLPMGQRSSSSGVVETSMPTLTKKQTCGTCGAKNPPEVTRCRICTRTLATGANNSTEAFAEALYAQPVRDTENERRWVPPGLVLLTVVVILGAVNYLWVGFGPALLHRPGLDPVRSGEWRTVTDLRTFSVVMPQNSIRDRVPGPGGNLQRVVASVDNDWIVVRGVDGIDESRRGAQARGVTATIVAASGPEISLDAEQIEATVEASLPGVDLADPTVTAVKSVSYGAQVVVDADFTGGTSRLDSGRMRARVIVLDGQTFVLATFSHGALDGDLSSKLVSSFRPDGKLAGPDPAR